MNDRVGTSCLVRRRWHPPDSSGVHGGRVTDILQLGTYEYPQEPREQGKYVRGAQETFAPCPGFRSCHCLPCSCSGSLWTQLTMVGSDSLVILCPGERFVLGR